MIKEITKYIYQNDINAICFQSTGSYTLNGKALLDDIHAHAFVREYPELSKNLSFKLKQRSLNIPFIIGAIDFDGKLISDMNMSEIKNKNYNKLIISCPVKHKINEEINFQLYKQSICIIEDYMQSLNINSALIFAPTIETNKNIIFEQ